MTGSPINPSSHSQSRWLQHPSGDHIIATSLLVLDLSQKYVPCPVWFVWRWTMELGMWACFGGEFQTHQPEPIHNHSYKVLSLEHSAQMPRKTTEKNIRRSKGGVVTTGQNQIWFDEQNTCLSRHPNRCHTSEREMHGGKTKRCLHL